MPGWLEPTIVSLQLLPLTNPIGGYAHADAPQNDLWYDPFLTCFSGRCTTLTETGFSPSPSTTAAPSRKSSVDTYESGGKCEEPVEPVVPKAASASAQPACLGALAIIGPILAFPIVTDFVGRMAVVLVVGLAIAALRRRMIDSGMWEDGEQKLLHGGESRNGTVLLGAYGVVMAVIAMLF